MSEEDESGGRGAGVLAGLLAPLRLPEKVMEALDELRPMRLELTRVREQTEALPELVPAIQRLDDRLASLERAMHELGGEVPAMHETVVGVKDDIQRTTGLRGDRGIMERARDALTGGHRDEDRPSKEDADDTSKEDADDTSKEDAGDTSRERPS